MEQRKDYERKLGSGLDILIDELRKSYGITSGNASGAISIERQREAFRKWAIGHIRSLVHEWVYAHAPNYLGQEWPDHDVIAHVGRDVFKSDVVRRSCTCD